MAYSRENLIISFDDFGKSREGNQKILELIRQKKADRVAVLVGKNTDKKEILELLNSGVKIDLHLDLEISNENGGAFRRSFLFLLYYFFSGKIYSREVEKNWEEQLKKFQTLFGKNPDGLNSHQHIHFFPPYFKIVLKLAEKYKLSYLRFGKKGIAENTNSISGILNWLWKINISDFRKFSFDSSEYLASYDWIKNFPLFLEKLPSEKTELVFHPERKEEFEAIKKYF